MSDSRGGYLPLILQAGRIKLARSHPYLSAAMWRLVPVECPEISSLGGPIGVDEHWRLYYDPGAITWTAEQCATVIYHEVLHLLRRHAGRCRAMAAHPRVWNVAGDMEINDDLEEERLEFPPIGHVTPGKFGQPTGRLAEEYYRVLMDNAVQVEVTGVMGGSCGSCATGTKEPWEVEGVGDGDSKGVSPIEGDILRQCVADAVQNHKGRGSVPGHLQRWADQWLAPPKVPWQKELASHLKKSLSVISGRVDYTYMRPSRRQAAYGKVVMPALRAPSPNVGVLVDTSGSMSGQDLQDAMGELKGILRSVGVGVDVMAVDAAVGSAKKVWDVRQVELVGGGGTDMGVGLEAMKGKRLGVVVVLTDCYTPWPTEKPPFDVIVGVIGGYSEGVPTWARKVIVG